MNIWIFWILFFNLILYSVDASENGEGDNVQTAKGVMFSTLDDVAKHLQSLGVKVRGAVVSN